MYGLPLCLAAVLMMRLTRLCRAPNCDSVVIVETFMPLGAERRCRPEVLARADRHLFVKSLRNLPEGDSKACDDQDFAGALWTVLGEVSGEITFIRSARNASGLHS